MPDFSESRDLLRPALLNDTAVYSPLQQGLEIPLRRARFRGEGQHRLLRHLIPSGHPRGKSVDVLRGPCPSQQ